MRIAPLTLVFCTGCTGLSLGLNAPGAPTRVAGGSIAVDERTDTAFVLAAERTAEGIEERLHAVPADGPSMLVAASASGGDQRLLFPDAGVLMMRETPDGGEVLTLFDRESFAERRTASVASRYRGTRVSPTGKWVAVADNDGDAIPIHIIEPSTLRVRPIPHRGEWLEAMWSPDRDLLVTAIFDGDVRVAAWSMDAVSARAFATDDSGAWSKPELDLTIPNKRPDESLSFTWLTSSADGRWVVVPVRDGASGDNQLVIVDSRDRTHRVVHGAKGPAGFTGDGSTIVSYASSPHAPDAADEMMLIDVASLETRRVKVPRLDRFNFHVLGATVTVAPTFEPAGSPRERGEHLPLFVFDAHARDPGIVIEPARVHLTEYVERPLDHDLWMVSHDLLSRIDLRHRTLEAFDLGFVPRHLNRLPKRDWLVLDQHTPGARTSPEHLVFWDPDEREIKRRVAIGTAR